VSLCNPTELSYDHYALMDDGSLRNGYWQNLEQMRTAALRSKLPFWNIVLTVAHFNYREPTAADLRFQVSPPWPMAVGYCLFYLLCSVRRQLSHGAN